MKKDRFNDLTPEERSVVKTKEARATASTARLQAQHDFVQDQIEALPEGKRNEIRALQAEVDVEIANMGRDLDETMDIEAQWRKATGLHHSDAEKVLRKMAAEPVGKIVRMFDKNWVHTPFKTIVEAQQYVNVLQDRVLQLTTVESEIFTQQLLEQRTQLVKALQEFTNLTWFGLIKLSFKRLFQRGNNG
jgi:hypothetical protein